MTSQANGQFERFADVGVIAELMGCPPEPTLAQRAGLERAEVDARGYGSIRPYLTA